MVSALEQLVNQQLSSPKPGRHTAPLLASVANLSRPTTTQKRTRGTPKQKAE